MTRKTPLRCSIHLAVTKQGVWLSEPLFERSLGVIGMFGSSGLRFDLSLDFVAIIAGVNRHRSLVPELGPNMRTGFNKKPVCAQIRQ